METAELKAKILQLLREDEEFRYAVAGLLGFEEILRRLDRHEAELVKIREDMMLGFRRHDEELARLREETNKLREDLLLGFRRHDEELAKLREEMNKLREDMIEGFNLLRRHIDALGARWGIMSEEAFREGIRGLVEKELGLKAEKWVKLDMDGYVFGHPSIVEIDVVLQNEKIILVEVMSHARQSDIYIFKRKSELYEKVEGRKPMKLLLITPYIEEKALETAKQFGIEIYTKI